ncbi:hypothetical protein BaRGS_00031001 [Batillaria attramentaria]|uniref:Uncharacterized protein n=1 Tax=Batillaria attramentaria TaxID=370345 RepID=A0ABD0JRV6_9CAEN
MESDKPNTPPKNPPLGCHSPHSVIIWSALIGWRDARGTSEASRRTNGGCLHSWLGGPGGGEGRGEPAGVAESSFLAPFINHTPPYPATSSGHGKTNHTHL